MATNPPSIISGSPTIWLHSLTPLDLAKTLALIQKSLRIESGKLIILEVYPLIIPKKYAVTYDENTLIKLLNILGWRCESGQVKLPAEYISAYWISAYKPDIKIVGNIERNSNEIRKMWHEEIMPRVCARYNDLSKISSVKNFFRYTSEFTSIMSIVNEERDLWRPTSRSSPVLNSNDVKRSEQIFKDESLRTKLLDEIRNADIDENLFLQITEVMTVLSQQQNEKNNISTSLILKADDTKNSYFEKYKSDIVEYFEEDFFDSGTKKLIEQALKVNGEDKAFVVLTMGENHKQYKIFVQTLRAVDDEQIQYNYFRDTRWNCVQFLIRDSGCALILPGDSRVKIIVKGELLAEYRAGNWKPRDFKLYSLKIQKLAELSSLDKSVLLNIFQKCISASETGQGLTLAIELKEGVILKRCDSNYEVLPDLREKTILDLSNKEYLSRVAGDGAAILDRNGYTIAVNALFQPQASTHIQPISKGARHGNAQKITKETQAIAFVVSVDGAISVLYQGEPVFRVL